MGALLKRTANYDTTIDVQLQVDTKPTSFVANVTMNVIPGDKPKRPAKAGEFDVSLFHEYKDDPDVWMMQAVTGNNPLLGASVASLVWDRALPDLPADYKVICTHTANWTAIDKHAQVEKHFHLDAYGNVDWEGPVIVLEAGSPQPSDFEQRRRHSLFKR